jgi:hypothetical protein
MAKNKIDEQHPFPNEISEQTVDETLMGTQELRETKRAARALARAMGYVREVCKSYKKHKQIEIACHKIKKNSHMFYFYLRRHDECREYAARFGLGIVVRPNPTETLTKELPLTPPEPPKKENRTFDLPRSKKIWTPEARVKAIDAILETLRIGVPFIHAVRYSGASEAVLRQWFEEDPELIDRMQQAESAWAVYFFKCLSTAAKVAADKGKFAELVDGAERRFAQQWAKVQAIDLTIKNESGETNYKQASATTERPTLDSLVDAIDAQFSEGDNE